MSEKNPGRKKHEWIVVVTIPVREEAVNAFITEDDESARALGLMTEMAYSQEQNETDVALGCYACEREPEDVGPFCDGEPVR